MGHLEEELLSQIKIQPDTSVQLGFPVLALTPSTVNVTFDLDIHADTCVLGKHAHIFMDHERSVNIVGYDKSKGTLARNMKTVSGAHNYDDPSSGTTVIIVVYQAIHVPTMDNNLVCLMQVLRMNYVKHDDKPKFLTEDPTDESHAISCDENMGTLVNITQYLTG